MAWPDTEPRGFYAGAGLNIETYDARVATDEAARVLTGDLAFYEKLATRAGGPVLELGSGTGRVALALATAGHQVVGIDLSPGMVAVAEARRQAHPSVVAARARFVEGDMTAFELPEQFGLAISPFRAFQAVLEPAGQRACLRAVARHLRPGGLLCLHLFDPKLDWVVPDAAPRFLAEGPRATHPLTGRAVRTTVLSHDSDPLHQRIVETWRFEELDDEGVPVRVEEERLSLRWTYRYEMRYLLELCGFEVEAEYSDFAGSAPAYAAEQVWVARRRPGPP